MCLSGTGNTPASRVAERHGYRLPTGYVHQVVYVAACGEPLVSESVPKPMRVTVLHSRLLTLTLIFLAWNDSF